MKNVSISDVRAFVLDQKGSGGDYHNREKGHWLVDTLIATPMSAYPEYRQSRTSFGIDVMNSIVVEVEASDGTVGVSAGQGGAPACYMIERHFKRFLLGQDPRNLNKMWDQMFRASLFYGRKGVPLWALSAVDLALWDLLGPAPEGARLPADRWSHPGRDRALLHRDPSRRSQGGRFYRWQDAATPRSRRP